MYSFKSFSKNHMIHPRPHEERAEVDGVIVVKIVHGLPIEFRDHKFQTESEEVAAIVRASASFGHEITEVTGAEKAEGKKWDVAPAKTKNEMITYLVSNKLASEPELALLTKQQIVEMSRDKFNLTFI